MSSNDLNIAIRTDKQLLADLGAFLQSVRLQQHKSQEETALAAGISRRTLIRIETGGGATLHNFLQILRALDRLDIWANFAVKPVMSPLALAKIEPRPRKRAGRKNTGDNEPTHEW